jgi:hypothetical protein
MVKNRLTIQRERHILFFKSENAAKPFHREKARANQMAEQASASTFSKKGALIKSECVKPFI